MLTRDEPIPAKARGAIERLLQQTGQLGFSAAAPFPAGKLAVSAEARDLCKTNRCGQYGKTWACPPACGTLPECAARLSRYSAGVLVQTVGTLEDAFDYPGMERARTAHAARFDALAAFARDACPESLPLGAGGCTRCNTCTYPDAPCRCPDTLYAPLEAYGLIVSDLCRRAGLPYAAGQGTVTYTSCILL